MYTALRRFLYNHGNIATKGILNSGLCPTLIEWLQGFFMVHRPIDSTAHSRPLNSLDHCICTTPMTNIRTSRDSNPVPLNSKLQPDRMSHRGRQVYTLQTRHTDSMLVYYWPTVWYASPTSNGVVVWRSFWGLCVHMTGLCVRFLVWLCYFKMTSHPRGLLSVLRITILKKNYGMVITHTNIWPQNCSFYKS